MSLRDLFTAVMLKAEQMTEAPEGWQRSETIASRWADVSPLRVRAIGKMLGLSELHARVIANVDVYYSPEASELIERELLSRGAKRVEK